MMKNIRSILLVAFVLLTSIVLKAQTSSDSIPASFPGGGNEWMKYLQRNLDLSVGSRNNAPAGNYKVIVSFQVDETGSVSKVKADNDPGYGYAKEAERIIKRGPKWKPATIKGTPVVFTQKQSITFVN
jgi:protein TonB